MPLVNPEIMRYQQSPDLQGALQQGLQTKGLLRQDQKAQRMQAFEQAFTQASHGLDLTSEDNLRATLQKTVQQFPEESLEVFKKYQEVFPKQKAPEFQLEKDDQGVFQPINKATGLNPQGKTVKGYQTPIKPDTTPTFKNGKDGFVHEWDPVAKKFVKTNLPVPEKEMRPDGPKSTDIFSQEQQLRTQYLGQTKDFRDVRDAYGRIKVSAKDPSPAGDLALIFNYMKMLDPGSTVREGEFANAQNAAGIPDQIRNLYNKAKDGTRLNPTQRADFLGRAGGLYAKQEFQAKKTKREYERIAKSYPGLDPSRVLMDDAEAIEPEAPAPAIAQVKDDADYDKLPPGTHFKGTDGILRIKP
jgi:hypothetical protein